MYKNKNLPAKPSNRMLTMEVDELINAFHNEKITFTELAVCLQYKGEIDPGWMTLTKHLSLSVVTHTCIVDSLL